MSAGQEALVLEFATIIVGRWRRDGLNLDSDAALADALAEQLLNLDNANIQAGNLERDLAEAKDLLREAYLGDHPTNQWRARVENLGAWPTTAHLGRSLAECADEDESESSRG